MKVPFSLIIDCLFTAFISFILSFVILNYFIDRPFSIIFSVIVAVLFCLAAAKKMNENNRNRLLKKDDKEAFLDMVDYFNFSSTNEQIEFFYRALKNNGYAVEVKNTHLYFKDKDVAFFPLFGFDEVKKSDVVKIFNVIKKSTVAFIVSENFLPEVENFAARFDGRIITVSAQAVYNFLKEKQSLPEKKILFTKQKQKKFVVLKQLLYKKKAKSYLAFGIIFLTMSYFVPIKLYYIIFGCLFLIAALVSRLFGKTENKNV